MLVVACIDGVMVMVNIGGGHIVQVVVALVVVTYSMPVGCPWGGGHVVSAAAGHHCCCPGGGDDNSQCAVVASIVINAGGGGGGGWWTGHCHCQ